KVTLADPTTHQSPSWKFVFVAPAMAFTLWGAGRATEAEVTGGGENAFCSRAFRFPREQMRSAHEHFAFPREQMRSAREHFAFPREQCDLLASISLFPVSKCDLLAAGGRTELESYLRSLEFLVIFRRSTKPVLTANRTRSAVPRKL